jgi:probable F420-dependent oxidoreductase
MKFVYEFPGRSVPADPKMLSARVMTELAVLAEQIGVAAVCLDEHPIPPEAWRRDPAGHDSLDPFAGLAAVAGATRRLQLWVNAAVVPYRNPFLLAKAAATLDVLSEGRLMLGLAAGYLPAEAAALGADFENRNAVFDESLGVMKLAWSGEPVTFKGRGFNADAVTSQPRPLQRPHPPLWFGGNSRASLRRVVEHGAGWSALPNAGGLGVSRRSPLLESIEDLKGYVARLRQLASEIGRTEPIGIKYSVRGGQDRTEQLRAVAELEEIGVTWSGIHGTGRTPGEAKDALKRFGDEVIAKL